MKRLILLLMTAPLWAQAPPPSYVLATGITFDAVTRQASTVNTLGVLVGNVKGLPTYQQTTIEMAYVRRSPTATDTAPTLRAGMAQIVYQKDYVNLGVCTDLGVSKIGDVATVATFSGCGFLTWDLGAKVTKGKYHVYLIPSFRMIALNGIQVKPSYSLRIGTGY